MISKRRKKIMRARANAAVEELGQMVNEWLNTDPEAWGYWNVLDKTEHKVSLRAISYSLQTEERKRAKVITDRFEAEAATILNTLDAMVERFKFRDIRARKIHIFLFKQGITTRLEMEKKPPAPAPVVGGGRAER